MSESRLKDPFHNAKPVGMSLRVHIVDPALVYTVYPDLAVAMYDMISGKENARVRYLPRFIVEKGQIARFAFLYEAQYFSLAGLLVGVPKKVVAVDPVDHLRES